MDGPGPGDGASPSEKKSVDESPIPQLPPHIPATEPQELSGLKRNLMILALGLGIFVGILDATIVATIVPTVADEFNAVESAGWFGSVYLLVTGATQPTFGKLYSTFSSKTIFLLSLLFLEIGSLICALAHSSSVFIGGRAVAGLGAAGIISGALIIVALITPMHLRPAYTSSLGSLEGVGLVVGPIIGGAIASNIGWRWCFWINLPVGAFLSAIIFLLFHPPRTTSPEDAQRPPTWKQRLLKLDMEGGLVIAASLACLLLALQWGGTTYAWSDGRIIGLFVVFGVTFICVALYERWKGEDATFPTRLLQNRTFSMFVLNGFCFAGAQFVALYYLPIWFQAVQGASAQESGTKLLPSVLSVIIMAIFGGIGASVVGYQPPFVFVATVLASTGAGMLYTLYPGIAASKWIGYQILFGSGTGMGIQQSIVGVQAAVDHADVAFSTAAIMLANTLSGAIFIAASQSVFLGEIAKQAALIPGASQDDFLQSFQSFRSTATPEELQAVIVAFNDGIRKTFLIALVLCCITVISWPLINWISIKQKKEQSEETEKKDDANA